MEWVLDRASDLAIIAAGVAAVIYLARIAYKARKPTHRFIRGVEQLVSIGAITKWPNGSTDLPSSLTEIYNRQCALQLQLNDVSRDLEALFTDEGEL